MRNYFALTPQSATKTKKAHAGGLILRGFVGAAMVAAIAGVMSGSASAAPGIEDEASTEANVAVNSAIALSGLTPSFTLTGLPGATVTGNGVVTFTVATNNLAGYAVTVESQTATMTSGDVANTDSVPVGALTVRETGGVAFTPLSSTSAVTVHTQATRSAEAGDALSNDYQVLIPFVNEDTYSATLDYIATTL